MNKNKRFIKACSHGNLEKVKKYLHGNFFSKPIDVNKVNDGYGSPLTRSIEHRRLDVIKLLVENGADINKTNISGELPLRKAISLGYTEIVKYLLSYGADSDITNSKGETPLIYAIQKPYIENVKLAITLGGDTEKAIYQKYHYSGDKRFERIKFTYLEIVELLLEKGANVDQADNDGRTPLYYATLDGHLEIVKLLVSMGANVNKSPDNGIPPIICALKNGHEEMVEFLKNAGGKSIR